MTLSAKTVGSRQPVCGCANHCLGCTDIGPRNCKGCLHASETIAPGVVECTPHCKDDEYPDDDLNCYPCDSECDGCSGPGPDSCVNCRHYLASETIDKSDIHSWCVRDCPRGYYGDEAGAHKHCYVRCDDLENKATHLFSCRNVTCSAQWKVALDQVKRIDYTYPDSCNRPS